MINEKNILNNYYINQIMKVLLGLNLILRGQTFDFKLKVNGK